MILSRVKSHRSRIWVVGLSIAIAFGLTSLPLPEWAGIWRPAWVAMVLIYWCLALPQRVGVATGWVSGLVLDVVMGTVLGQHALALSVIAFCAHKWHQRLRVLAPWQQAGTIFVFVFLNQTLVFWVNGARGVPVEGLAYLTGPLTSMLLWPWVFSVLRDARRRYSVE